MKRILRFELMKIWHPFSFIYWILFSIAFIVFSYDEPSFIKRFMSSNFRYNEEIIINIFYFASYYKYLLTLFIIYITSREFANNTIIRSIYEGFSRKELFVGKLAVLAILTLFVFLLTRIILMVLFLVKGYSFNTISFMLLNYHFVIAELFSCFSLGLFGIMLSSLVKNLYWSIGLFIAWGYFEYLLQMFSFMTPFQEMANYLPLYVMTAIYRTLRFNEFGLLQLFYLFTLQQLFLLVIYNQYNHITWLRKH